MKISKKILVIGMFLIVVSVFVYSTISQITSFTGRTNPFNISLTPNINRTFNLSFPMYSYPTNATLSLQGFLANSSFVGQYPDDNPFGFIINTLIHFNQTNSSGTVAVDSTDNHNATFAEANFTSSGKFGNAINYSGGWLKIDSEVAQTKNFTTMMWVNLSSGTAAREDLFQWVDGGSTGILFTNNFPVQNQVTLILEDVGGSEDCRVISDYNLNDDTWHHIGFSRANNSAFVFIDGVITSRNNTCAVQGSYSPATNNIHIGTDSGEVLDIVGQIDDFMMINGTINQSLLSFISEPYPTDLYIEVGDPDGVREYNRTGKLSITEDADLNISVFRNILNDNCNCSECVLSSNICSIPVTFNSQSSSILGVTVVNISYETDVGSCDDPKLNFTILNTSYINDATSSPIVANNTYNLQMTNPFSISFSGEATNANSHLFCTNVNVTDRDLTYDIFGSFRIVSSGFITRIFQNDAANPYQTQTDPRTFLTLGLISNATAQTVSFTIKDFVTTEALSGVQANMFQIINGSPVLSESRISSVTGRVQFSYIPNQEYQFVFTLANYNDLTFTENPIQSDSFEVFMTPSVIIDNVQDYDQFAVFWTPQEFTNDLETNFSWTISAPYGNLQSYGYTATFPGGTSSNSGTTGVGETLETNFTITGAVLFDRLKLEYYYVSDVSGTRNFTAYYDILITPGNLTMVQNRNKTYGLGLFERIIISSLIIFLIVGLGTLGGQPLPSFALGLLVMGYLVVIGFMPIWSTLLGFFVAVILLSVRSE